MVNFEKIVVFDLDGTVLTDNRLIGDKDLTVLYELKKKKCLRIAATGRNLLSVKRVLSDKFPVDFVVFSSGAGVIDWKQKEIFYTSLISRKDIDNVIKAISPFHLNFTIHLPIPDNHKILLHAEHPEAGDLIDYTNHYREYVSPLDIDKLPDKATQMIVLLNNRIELYDILSSKLNELKTVLTTSPVNKESLWMEVFNIAVSKAEGVKRILQKVNNNLHSEVIALGNDFNDLDLLEFADFSYVVSGAPDKLKQMYKTTVSNNDNPLSVIINELGIFVK